MNIFWVWWACTHLLHLQSSLYPKIRQTFCLYDQILNQFNQSFQIDSTAGYALFMLTRGQQIVVDVNDTVIVDCQFQETTDDRFNLFDNPVHWSKSQLDERSQINMMVNLVEPFSEVDQGRLRVSFAGTSPNYTMTLVIARRSTTASFSVVFFFSVFIFHSSQPSPLAFVFPIFLHLTSRVLQKSIWWVMRDNEIGWWSKNRPNGRYI